MTTESRNYAPAISLIKEFEGCDLRAYNDGAGTWTIGWGTIKYPNGNPVLPGDRCTQAEADFYLENDLAETERVIAKDVPAFATNNEVCALVSFEYNEGEGALERSTLLRLFRSGYPLPEVADQFLVWDRAGGRVMRGLLRRRRAERALFLTPDAQAAAHG